MTTLYAVEGQSRGRDEETLTEAVARRLREQMGGRRISQRALARQLGETPTWVNSRVLGRISMSMDDVEAIAEATGISAAYLMAGVNAENRRPTMKSDGGSKYTPRESNPEPTEYSSEARNDAAAVITLPTTRKPSTRPAPTRPADVIDLAASRTATGAKAGEVTA